MLFGIQSAVFSLLALEVTALSGFQNLLCLSRHCGKESLSCLNDKKCFAALNCNRKCGTGPTNSGCNLLCELTDGYENPEYKTLLRCMARNKCLPVSSKPDGICKAKRSDGIKALTTLDDVKGTWWILKGLNCGQEVFN